MGDNSVNLASAIAKTEIAQHLAGTDGPCFCRGWQSSRNTSHRSSWRYYLIFPRPPHNRTVVGCNFQNAWSFNLL